MNWNTKRGGLIVAIGALTTLSASAITDPFSVDPYPASETTTPEAPSRTPVTQPGVNPTNPLPPFTSPIEDLFHRNYWYLVLLDTKEVFTSPKRWDSRDWLTLGAITAGIGTVMVFDEDIQHGIRSGRSNTHTNIF